jgi:hypothetical protein
MQAEVIMCRWIAYAGPDIYLEDLIFNQEHCNVLQTLAATQSAWVTNGDGFGVAWYNNRNTPGLFKDILPAWNDSNLRSLAAHIKTRLFFCPCSRHYGNCGQQKQLPSIYLAKLDFHAQLQDWQLA